MPREAFKPIELDAKLKPVAAPVDTFIRPQEPSRDTNLQDLARSLSALGGSLGGMIGKRDREAEADARVQGEAAFWQGNPSGAASGVSQGLIPAQASPAFMRGYRETAGAAAGGILQEKFAAAYDSWEGKSSVDPNALTAFTQNFLRENIKTSDPDELRGLLPKVQQLVSNYQQRHIADASRAVMDEYVSTLGVRADQALEAASSAGLASRAGVPYGEVFGELDAYRAEGLSRGANAEKLDRALVDAVVAKAVAKRDPQMLTFLDRKVPGQDYSWSNSPYGRDEKQKAINTLEAMGRRSIADDESKRREEKAAAKDAVTRDTIGAITRAPNEPIPEELLARGEKVDPDFRVNAIRWRDTIGKGTQTSDNGDMLAVTTDILNGGGVARVQRGIRDGVFKNPEDLTRAYKLAEGMVKDGGALDGMLKGSSAKAVLDTIKKRTASKKDLSRQFDDGSMSSEGLQAQTDFRLQVLAWRQAHPEAGLIEQEDAVAKLGAGVLDRIFQTDTGGAVLYDRRGIQTPNTFGSLDAASDGPDGPAPVTGNIPAAPKPATQTRGPNYANPNVVVPSGLPGADDPAPSQSAPTAQPVQPPQPTPKAPSSVSTAANPGDWFNEQPPETRAFIERKAAEEGKPVGLKTEEFYRGAVAKGWVKPAASAGQPQAAPIAPGRQSMLAPDGTPIESATVNTTAGPAADAATAATVSRFGNVLDGAYVGRASFDGTKATLNGRTFSSPTSPEQVARQFEGLSENDPEHRKTLTMFLSKAAGQRIDPAVVPWCAAFVDSVLDASGRKTRGSLRASDFLDYGTSTDSPTRGDVVVFKSMARGSTGHVGFVVGIEGDRVRYIAGNDDGKVQEDTLPMSKVAGFRHPPEAGTPGPFTAGAGGGSGQADTAGAFTRALSNTASPAGTYAAPELQADPKAARILDMVSGAELSAGKAANYNAIYGNAGATEDLSKRSLDETIAWSRSRGTSSSATGRFQFMAGTLESLKTEMGLTGREPFSPALQDRMALALLNRRGYREWTAGKLTDDAFAAELAKEWASLPNPATGKSHYAGDGVNKSLVSASQVRAALSGTGAFPAARAAAAAGTMAKQASQPAFTEKARSTFGGGGASQPTASDAYANAPDASLAARLRAANPDPVKRSSTFLQEVPDDLAEAVRKAQADNPRLRFIVASRGADGSGAEIWPVDAEGRVSFDPNEQGAVMAAIERSAVQLGFGVNVGKGQAGERTLIRLAGRTRRA